MIKWGYIVVLLNAVLLFFLLWKEIKRPNKSRLAWRIAATITAVASLACIALPLTYKTTEQEHINKEAVVLTDGFDAKAVSGFIKTNPDMPVLFFDKSINAKQYGAQYVADVSLLPQQQKNISVLHIFGYGFDEAQLSSMPAVSLSFHPSGIPAGITAVNWQQHLQAGKTLVVQGNYNNASSSKTKIILSGFNTVLDSAYIASNTQVPFSLTAIPKLIGRTTYMLSVVSHQDTIVKEAIPVQVEEGARLKILMLASSPDFENKFLKNGLAENGYELAARTIISKNKYAFEYFNISSFPLDKITNTVLNKFDILIADAAALSSMPKNELRNIQSAVAQQALGLIVVADTVAPASFYIASFPLHTVANNTQPVVTYLLDSTAGLPALYTDNVISISNLPDAQPLVFDRQNKVYVSSTLFGAGKVIFTTLSNTYTWALAGNEEVYKKYWATLLNKAAAEPPTNEEWSIEPALSFVNMPVQLLLQTNNTVMPQGEVNGTAVYLKMNAALPYQWSGKYYPSKQGWQTVVGLNGKPFYWYAFGKENWKTIVAAQKITATENYISGLLDKNKIAATKSVIKENSFNKIYFFILLLMACAFLWAENKYALSLSK